MNILAILAIFAILLAIIALRPWRLRGWWWQKRNMYATGGKVCDGFRTPWRQSPWHFTLSLSPVIYASDGTEYRGDQVNFDVPKHPARATRELRYSARGVEKGDSFDVSGEVMPDGTMEGDRRPGVMEVAGEFTLLMDWTNRRWQQCANNRWHQLLKEMPCEYGPMPYHDARAAHEAARRIRHRIPQGWELYAILGVLFSQAVADGIAALIGLLLD